MIWTLKIECVLGRYLSDEWVRVIEIDSRTTLSDIHEEIQDEIGFDRDHLFEFFAGRNAPASGKAFIIDQIVAVSHDDRRWNE